MRGGDLKRLEFFAQMSVKKSDGERSTNRAIIKKRLTQASRTGECVDLTLKDETRRHCRLLHIADGWVELEEYDDDPFTRIDTRVVRITQIVTLRWRSSIELLVTKVWKTKRKI